jgi:hypothetical protein
LASAVFVHLRVVLRTWSRGLGAFALLTTASIGHARTPDPVLGSPPRAAHAPVSAVDVGAPGALAALERSYRDTNDPDAGIAFARALVESGRWLDAEAVYTEVAGPEDANDASPPNAGAALDTEREREQLRARIPAILFQVVGNPITLEVSLNGVAVPRSELGDKRRVDPGPVRVLGLLDGARVETELTIGEGETRTVQLAALPRAARPSSAKPPARAPAPETAASSGGARTPRIVSFVAMGIGGAALITGGVFGALAIGDQQSLSERCPRGACPRRLEPEVDAYESKKTIATVGLASGLVLGLGGVALFLTARPSAPKSGHAQIGAFVTGDRAGVWGEF